MYRIDPVLDNLPYKSLLSSNGVKLKIGVIDYSPHMKMTKPQLRAYKLAQKALKDRGHSVEPLNLDGLYEASYKFIHIAASTVHINFSAFDGEFTSGESLAFRQA